MAEYIDKAAIMSRIESQAREWGEEYDAEQILGDIEDFPAADVRPVVRGNWVGIDDEPFTTWECDRCGCIYEVEFEYLPNFCPNCGACMRKED